MINEFRTCFFDLEYLGPEGMVKFEAENQKEKFSEDMEETIEETLKTYFKEQSTWGGKFEAHFQANTTWDATIRILLDKPDKCPNEQSFLELVKDIVSKHLDAQVVASPSENGTILLKVSELKSREKVANSFLSEIQSQVQESDCGMKALELKDKEFTEQGSDAVASEADETTSEPESNAVTSKPESVAESNEATSEPESEPRERRMQRIRRRGM